MGSLGPGTASCLGHDPAYPAHPGCSGLRVVTELLCDPPRAPGDAVLTDRVFGSLENLLGAGPVGLLHCDANSASIRTVPPLSWASTGRMRCLLVRL